MAQTPSPSLSFKDGQTEELKEGSEAMKSDTEVPVDPNISVPSPSYPAYSPYAHDMGQYQNQTPPTGYAQQPQHWSQPSPGYPPSMSGAPYSSPGSTASGTPGSMGSARGQVYSFVPIPGAQQHKRPRRRYEEIERMYKCGFEGCDKSYGTLNHLNAHVTMQSHGAKRTPEEFKEIRKEWKQRKKEEENHRKAEEERARQNGGAGDAQSADPNLSPEGVYHSGNRPQLPPLGYGPPGGQVPHQYPGGVDQMYSASSNGQVYTNYPQSPYGQSQQL